MMEASGPVTGLRTACRSSQRREYGPYAVLLNIATITLSIYFMVRFAKGDATPSKNFEGAVWFVLIIESLALLPMVYYTVRRCISSEWMSGGGSWGTYFWLGGVFRLVYVIFMTVDLKGSLKCFSHVYPFPNCHQASALQALLWIEIALCCLILHREVAREDSRRARSWQSLRPVTPLTPMAPVRRQPEIPVAAVNHCPSPPTTFTAATAPTGNGTWTEIAPGIVAGPAESEVQAEAAAARVVVPGPPERK